MGEVLLVGPEDVFPAEMEECIHGQGHSTCRALGSGQALIESDKADKLLAFIDAGSSLYSAQDLMRKILVRRPEACVVVTSTEPSVDMAVEFIKDGAWDFLIRPVEPEKLALVLDQTIGGSDKAAAPIDEDEEDGPAIITNDPAFKKLLSIAEQAAGAAAAVLIQGESGTGKEMLARFIHMKSPRRDKPFVAINCAALPEALLESELFGHEKGAFTGAISRRLGKFELASGGSILLDEITEMQLHLQAKLLRVLQEQVLDRQPDGRRQTLPEGPLSRRVGDVGPAMVDGAYEDQHRNLVHVVGEVPGRSVGRRLSRLRFCPLLATDL